MRRSLVLLGGGLFLFALGFRVNWSIVKALDPSVIWRYKSALLYGYGTSLMITGVATALGLAAGTIFAVLSQSPIPLLRWIIVAYIEAFRNTPLLVQLIWIHFALPLLTGVSTTALQSGIIAITLQVTAYFTEIVRAGIEATPRGQWDAAYALGLTAWTRWSKVILPQAARIIVPALVNLFISLFKATAILTVLSINELMTMVYRISNFTYKPIELYTFAALIYFITGYAMSQLAGRIELRFRRADG
jgi:polar amino acid transport system permease protein